MKMRYFTAAMLVVAGVFLASGQPAVAGHAHHGHDGAAESSVAAPADAVEYPDCVHCGMDRVKFAHSRMLIVYQDGEKVATCSIRCVALDLKTKKNKPVASFQVGDFTNGTLIDAEKAHWVIGGDRRGVMTKTPKWAFADKETAEAFIARHGGTPATFAEAIKAATDEL
ncbi:nitrous oxide reductase accessory protein NosL [Geobacter sulfurreducens]|uniref:nitrous oxide reductase accessory protein NosL n=1 Tax=Geobacter sulfurreducens TaxID=35554 RepID=UPI000DBB6445|nr:nitrous oxide reductase accessory protein NosL [Geobacter sulfurreducens]BBA69807.1 hypothetical protein YM18_1265 [Geobacter sulfurreducens]